MSPRASDRLRWLQKTLNVVEIVPLTVIIGATLGAEKNN